MTARVPESFITKMWERARMRARPATLAAVVAAAALLAGLPAWSQPAVTNVVIGHSNVRNDIAALWAPRETGIFAKYGLEVTPTLVEGGRQMTQAILSGSIPIGFTGVPTVASAVAAGGDAVIILGITNKVTFDIWAKPEITRPADLRGRVLGISGFGATSHVGSFLMLRQFGLNPVKDRITFLAVGDEALRAQALLGGRIDATLIDPSVAGPVRDKGFSFLGNMEKLGIPFINNALVSTRRYLREQPKIVENVVRAIVEGNAYMLDPANRRVVTEVLAKNLRLDPEKAETAYRDLLPKVERKPYPSMEAIAATIQVMGEQNPQIAPLKPEQLVDLSVLKRLDQDGVIDRLYRK